VFSVGLELILIQNSDKMYTLEYVHLTKSEPLESKRGRPKVSMSALFKHTT